MIFLCGVSVSCCWCWHQKMQLTLAAIVWVFNSSPKRNSHRNVSESVWVQENKERKCEKLRFWRVHVCTFTSVVCGGSCFMVMWLCFFTVRSRTSLAASNHQVFVKRWAVSFDLIGFFLPTRCERERVEGWADKFNSPAHRFFPRAV